MNMQNLQEWHKAVCERDQYICQLQIAKECKKDYSYEHYFNEKGVNQYVCGDHLNTQGSAPEKRLVISNGKCVCSPCHALRHHTPDDELPEGYLAPYVSIGDTLIPGKTYLLKATLPNGQVIRGNDNLCKCKRYLIIEATGICMNCEKRNAPTLKQPKKKKS